jgi:hypothetical protein
MSSQRLTLALKDEIRKKMVDYAYKAKIEEAKILVGQAIYNELATPQALSLPPSLMADGWIAVMADVAYRVKETLNDYASYDYIKLPKPIPVKVVGNADPVICLTDEGPMVDVVKNLRFIEGQKNALEDDIRSALASVGTVKQLLEVLPEAADFVPDSNKPMALVDTTTLARIRAQLSK